MCELMALSFAEPISADFSIREFALRGEENADGWGLAWYPDQSVSIVKEPLRWRESGHSGFLETYPQLKSRVYLAHVRDKTVGGVPTHADTHPFVRERNGVEYCFAHNGTIAGHEELELGRYRPVGGTDSEHVFCHLLQRMDGADRTLQGRASWRWLHETLLALNARGNLNILLTDGRFVCCYWGLTNWKALHYRQVHIRRPAQPYFEDETISLELDAEGVNHGYVVATRPLSQHGWRPFLPGQLVIFENGHLRYSKAPEDKIASPQVPITDANPEPTKQ